MKQETSNKLKLNTDQSQDGRGGKDLRDLGKGEKYECRISIEGDVTNGHWVNRAKGQPTMGGGFKFVFTKDDRGFVRVKNLDYGWIREKQLTDERGTPYDTVTENAQGFDFDNEPFVDVESAYDASVKWLQTREKLRVL